MTFGGALSSEILNALKVPAGTVTVSIFSTLSVIRRTQVAGQFTVIQRTSPVATWPTLSGHCSSSGGSRVKPRGPRWILAGDRFFVNCISLPGPAEKT